MLDLSEWLNKMGVPAGTFARLKGGRGVVGRTSLVALGALTVLGIVAARLTDPTLLLYVALLAVGLCLAALFWLPIWASKNPQLAVMEGLDLAAYKHAEAAALGLPKPPDTPVIADPGIVDVIPNKTGDGGA